MQAVLNCEDVHLITQWSATLRWIPMIFRIICCLPAIFLGYPTQTWMGRSRKVMVETWYLSINFPQFSCPNSALWHVRSSLIGSVRFYLTSLVIEIFARLCSADDDASITSSFIKKLKNWHTNCYLVNVIYSHPIFFFFFLWSFNDIWQLTWLSSIVSWLAKYQLWRDKSTRGNAFLHIRWK